MIQKIATTHQLPSDCAIEVIGKFRSNDGDTFNIWSIRLRVPMLSKPGWTAGCTIREQCVSTETASGVAGMGGVLGGARLEYSKPQ